MSIDLIADLIFAAMVLLTIGCAIYWITYGDKD